MDDIINRLTTASNARDVEMALNMIVLPDKNSDEFGEYKTRLYTIFEKIIVVNGLTNKQIRRRMERMMFVLHDGNTGEKKKVLPVIDRSSYEYKPTKHFNSKTSLLHESFLAFITLTKNENIVADDIEQGLDKIGGVLDSDSTIDEDTKAQLLQALEVLGDNDKLELNSKLRRRLKRMGPTIENLSIHSKRQKL